MTDPHGGRGTGGLICGHGRDCSRGDRSGNHCLITLITLHGLSVGLDRLLFLLFASVTGVVTTRHVTLVTNSHSTYPSIRIGNSHLQGFKSVTLTVPIRAAISVKARGLGHNLLFVRVRKHTLITRQTYRLISSTRHLLALLVTPAVSRLSNTIRISTGYFSHGGVLLLTTRVSLLKIVKIGRLRRVPIGLLNGHPLIGVEDLRINRIVKSTLSYLSFSRVLVSMIGLLSRRLRYQVSQTRVLLMTNGMLHP